MPLTTGKYGNVTLRSPGQSVGKRIQVRRGIRTNVRRSRPTAMRLTLRRGR